MKFVEEQEIYLTLFLLNFFINFSRNVRKDLWNCKDLDYWLKSLDKLKLLAKPALSFWEWNCYQSHKEPLMVPTKVGVRVWLKFHEFLKHIWLQLV